MDFGFVSGRKVYAKTTFRVVSGSFRFRPTAFWAGRCRQNRISGSSPRLAFKINSETRRTRNPAEHALTPLYRGPVAKRGGGSQSAPNFRSGELTRNSPVEFRAQARLRAEAGQKVCPAFFGGAGARRTYAAQTFCPAPTRSPALTRRDPSNGTLPLPKDTPNEVDFSGRRQKIQRHMATMMHHSSSGSFGEGRRIRLYVFAARPPSPDNIGSAAEILEAG